jgi:Na+-transporting methylmalonyl-CoA/oxaloacetate decarboxylase gamma subunit
MIRMTSTPEPDRFPPESPAQRADRNLVELLQELRVIQTGVQIVFAFLLGLAFTSRVPQLTAFQVDVYITTLLLSVLTAAVLATPVAIHRALFHRGYKRQIVKASARLTVIGMGMLTLALNGAVLLVTDVVLGHGAAAVITATTTAVFVGLWFVLPWTLRPDRADRRNRRP